jgi:hypothetical protein
MPTSTLMIFDPQLAASACALGVLGIVDSSRVKGPLRGCYSTVSQSPFARGGSVQHSAFLSLTSERTRRAICMSLRDFWLEVILSFPGDTDVADGA